MILRYSVSIWDACQGLQIPSEVCHAAVSPLHARCLEGGTLRCLNILTNEDNVAQEQMLVTLVGFCIPTGIITASLAAADGVRQTLSLHPLPQIPLVSVQQPGCAGG